MQLPRSIFLLTLSLFLILWSTKAHENNANQAEDDQDPESRGQMRMVWSLEDPELSVRKGKLFVKLKGPRNLKNVFFYMSVNKDFTRFKDAQVKVKLKCNRARLCRRVVGPLLEEGDEVHYGMVANLKRTKPRRQSFLGRTFIPIPVKPLTTTEGPLASVSCSILTNELPPECVENRYTVPNSFQSTSEGRRNPERGFYRYTDSKSSSWTPVENYPLSNWVQEGYTLIYRIYVFDTFINSDISEDVLQKIGEDFETIRNVGLKVILRFSYSIDINEIDDAPPEQLKKHIEQLTPLLQGNADVIAVVQTGFIGVWGEWYYTSNYGNEGNISPDDWENRRQVVFQLLEALPVYRQIELRVVKYKRIILNHIPPVTAEEAHTEAKVARIGHHNDCFLASETDYGTYENKSEEYPYLQSDTMYVAQGGETCNLNPTRSDCPTALKEMSELHFSYLNSQYHPDVLQSWKDQGCYNEVDMSLGYRFVGVLCRLPEAVGVGTIATVGMKGTNMGWASPINYRSAQLTMIHKITGEEHLSPVSSDLDLRNWLPGDYEFDLTLDVPSSATVGEYEVFLKLADGTESLKDLSQYNIVMENLVYEDDLERRLNLLGTTIVI